LFLYLFSSFNKGFIVFLLNGFATFRTGIIPLFSEPSIFQIIRFGSATTTEFRKVNNNCFLCFNAISPSILMTYEFKNVVRLFVLI
jgi:hypothetical protein